MVSQLEPRRRRGSAPLTRTRLLNAAEALFAERGFDATRLEDIARAVGIRRASIVYHFRDKRTVYHAVFERLLQALHEALSQALSRPGDGAARIEAAIGAWLEFLRARPTFGPLLLREFANAGSSDGALVQQIDGFYDLVGEFLAELEIRDEHFADAVDPPHFAAAIVGATVLYSVSLPSVVSDLGEAGGRERHCREVLRITRRLMGVGDGAPPREPA